jgi:hypothetical protein
LFSLYRGNSANIFKQFFQCGSKIIFFYQINFFLFGEKISKNENFTSKEILISSFLSALINNLFSYPFDLAHSRICGDMTRINFKRLNSSVLEVFNRCINNEGKFFS